MKEPRNLTVAPEVHLGNLERENDRRAKDDEVDLSPISGIHSFAIIGRDDKIDLGNEPLIALPILPVVPGPVNQVYASSLHNELIEARIGRRTNKS